jgi:hypothetical protein
MTSTRGGVHISGLQVTAPVLLWVKSLDLLLQKLNVSNVKAISGCGQVIVSSARLKSEATRIRVLGCRFF